jgi:RNA-directed DNA polymerase
MTPTLIRYCDDFVVLHENLAVIEQSQQLIQEWLNDMGLELKPSKTQISHTLIPHQDKVGFDFLGFSIRQFPVGKHTSGKQRNGKPLGFKTIISPSKAKLKQHASDIGSIIHQLRGISQIGLIARLKPIIFGWCNYFRYGVCSKAFSKLDHILFQQLKAWSKRRHPNKSKRWRRHRYWHRTASNQFRFAARFNGIEIVLPLHAETNHLSHVKVQSHRSPFDADWIYWSSRLGRFPGVSRTEAFLLKRQKGKCPLCNLFFKHGDLLEIDHRRPRAHGGNNSILNQQILHRHCHHLKTLQDKQAGIIPNPAKSEPGMIVNHPFTEEPNAVKMARSVLEPSRGGDPPA